MAGVRDEYSWVNCQKFREVPLYRMRSTFRVTVARHLNPHSDLLTRSGLISDWRGLAEQFNCDYLDIQNLKEKKDPTCDLLERAPRDMTLAQFLQCLQLLERYDCLQAIQPIVERDAEYILQLIRREREGDIIQDPHVTGSEPEKPDGKFAIGDTNEKKQYFDAFVSYTDSEKGIEFRDLAIKHLEVEREDPLRLFIAGRDQIVGVSGYKVTAEIIENRCNRFLVLLDRQYLQSQECDFQLAFAQALSPGARTRRIIPIVIEEGVQMPSVLKFITCCDYTRRDLHKWFWDRLYHSIKSSKPSRSDDSHTDLRQIVLSLRSDASGPASDV